MATKDFSSKQEKMIADYLGWSVVSGSGAAACFPGDVISDEWLGECKTHVERGQKILFNKKVWDKICDEAMVKRRFPVLFTDDGSQKSGKTWCLFASKHLDFSECRPVMPLCLCKLHGQGKNISFDHSEMLDLYNQEQKEFPERIQVFLGSWNTKEDVVVVPLETFKEIIEK